MTVGELISNLTMVSTMAGDGAPAVVRVDGESFDISRVSVQGGLVYVIGQGITDDE